MLLIPIFNVLKKTKFFARIVSSFEEKFQKESSKISSEANENKNKELKKWLGIMTFVAIPLPLTGVWTGSAIAVFLKMGFWKSISATSVGAVIAACIMTAVSKLLGEKALAIFYIFALLLVVTLVAYLISSLVTCEWCENLLT